MSLSNREIFLRHLGLPSVDYDALEIESAKGIYLFSADGKKYIDLVSGVSVSNLGHGHPEIVHAVKAQAENFMHLMVYGKYIQSPQVKLAEKLVRLLPSSLNSVFFVNSGSEAIEGALKLAKRVTGRSRLISFKYAYHGSTHGALSLLGDEEMKYAYRPLLPEVFHLEFNSFEDIEQINDKVAAVLIEPVQAETGIIVPEPGFLTALRKKCDETGALLIFDEIQMGFGRTAKLFAFENFNVIPDILCLAKAMGAGMPIGAFIAAKEKMDTLTFNPALGHITTFGGHPVCAAAALKGLEILLNEGLIDQADQKGKLFYKLLAGHKKIAEIRQIGLMLGVELGDNKNAPKLIKLLLEEGLVVDQFLFNDRSFRIAPPLSITENEIEMIAAKVLTCLDRV